MLQRPTTEIDRRRVHIHRQQRTGLSKDGDLRMHSCDPDRALVLTLPIMHNEPVDEDDKYDIKRTARSRFSSVQTQC